MASISLCHPVKWCARPLAAACLFAGALLTPSLNVQAQSNTPNMGDDGTMSLAQERHLGDQIGREIYRDAQYLSDPVLDDYLASIWQPLYAQAKLSGALPAEMDRQLAWRLFLVRDKTVNAFALPGAYFGVHLGLLALSDTPDVLASVLAHELTHVTQRHISRGMAKQGAKTPWLLAGALIGLLAMRNNPQIASAALSTGQAAAIQGQLNFSRDFEREADRLGLALMLPAGYNPSGFIAMFDMLGKASRLSDNGQFPYLLTHPLTTEREAEMRTRVSDFGQIDRMSGLAAQRSNALQLHRLMAARANVLSDTSVDALHAHMRQGSLVTPNTPHRTALLYAAALAASQAKEPGRAQDFYQQLKAAAALPAAAPIQEAVRWLGIELGALSEAPAQDLTSQSRVELLYAAQQEVFAPNKAVAARQALINRLQVRVISQPLDSEAWQYLAQLQAMQNQPVRASISTAEALRAQLDDAAALAQYQFAQLLLRQAYQRHEAIDEIDAAIIDSKVRELQQSMQERDAQKQP